MINSEIKQETTDQKIVAKTGSDKCAKPQESQGFPADSGDEGLVRYNTSIKHPSEDSNNTPETDYYETTTISKSIRAHKSKNRPSETPLYFDLLRKQILQSRTKRNNHNWSLISQSSPLRKPWDEMDKIGDDSNKVTCAIYAAWEARSLAFNLDLTPRLQKRLMDSGSPLTSIKKDMHARFKEEFGFQLPFFIILEFPTNGEPHFHGFACLPDKSQRSQTKFRKAMKKVGGKMKGPGSGRQFETVWIYDPVGDFPEGNSSKKTKKGGWLGYIRKNMKLTRRNLNPENLKTGKISFMNDPMRRMARDYQEGHRYY